MFIAEIRNFVFFKNFGQNTFVRFCIVTNYGNVGVEITFFYNKVLDFTGNIFALVIHINGIINTDIFRNNFKWFNVRSENILFKQSKIIIFKAVQIGKLYRSFNINSVTLCIFLEDFICLL